MRIPNSFWGKTHTSTTYVALPENIPSQCHSKVRSEHSVTYKGSIHLIREEHIVTHKLKGQNSESVLPKVEILGF